MAGGQLGRRRLPCRAARRRAGKYPPCVRPGASPHSGRVRRLLALNVEDLDPPNRRARVRRKGGAIDVIVWQTGTARLLTRLLKGRKTGPVFATERKARVQLPAANLDEHGHARLSYQQAAALFSDASGGATLHQLRHSTLTHDAEDTPVRRC
jgi:integrase